MKHKLTYITALALLSSCSDYDEMPVGMLLNGSSKTPIAIRTNISVASQSRAYDKTFETGDLLFAYIEAGKPDANGDFKYENQFFWANNFTMQETIDNGGASGVGNITTSYALSPTIYWDNFSSTEYDLRKNDRGIRLKYGYCYNGGQSKATNSLLPNGTLTWTLSSDQSNPIELKQSDLLYAATQPMITYNHNEDERGVLELPYTHAMSKITINVTAGETYYADRDNFNNATLTLKNMQTKADVDAPNATVTPSAEQADVKDILTYKSNVENRYATFLALVAPTKLTVGNELAVISSIDRNTYTIPLTQGILDAWSADEHMWIAPEVINNGTAQAKPRKTALKPGVGFMTKPGIHYILDVTVDKQQITVRATIADWDTVGAEGEGQITFANDVTEKGSIDEALKTGGFDVYKSITDAVFNPKTTSVTNVDDVWTYDPVIYWSDAYDNSYFRAISPAGTDVNNISQGVDVLWGTSGAEAIKPRTGDVNLDFVHAMSKISIQLETTTDASQVTLGGATISISNLSTSGSINLVNGEITPADASVEGIAATLAPVSNYAVIPQTLTAASIVTITLADGTVYKLNLNECKDAGDNAVTEWEPGIHYTYSIHLEKEQITFRAVVKEWDSAEGSGNATLEWDDLEE